MPSGFKIPRTILTSCQPHSVHHFSIVPQSENGLPLPLSQHNPQTGTNRCLLP